MENKMKEVAKLLGVELEEEFNLKDGFSCNPYKLTDEGLVNGDEEFTPNTFIRLLDGAISIEKIPFKPQVFQHYYFVKEDGEIGGGYWTGLEGGYYRYNADNCFRTSEEITDEDIKRILKEMRGKYDEG